MGNGYNFATYAFQFMGSGQDFATNAFQFTGSGTQTATVYKLLDFYKSMVSFLHPFFLYLLCIYTWNKSVGACAL